MLQQFFPAVPARQATEGIPAQHQEQLVVDGQFGADRFQRIDGVRRLVTRQLTGIHAQAWHALHGTLHHGQAVVRGHLRGVAVRRPGVGQQAQLVQPHEFGHFQRTAQVADVHGVEGAA
ncbi:hypothetical protein D9M71_704740 [compost metagenome]